MRENLYWKWSKITALSPKKAFAVQIITPRLTGSYAQFWNKAMGKDAAGERGVMRQHRTELSGVEFDSNSTPERRMWDKAGVMNGKIRTTMSHVRDGIAFSNECYSILITTTLDSLEKPLPSSHRVHHSPSGEI